MAEWPVAGWQGGARNEPYLAVDSAGNVYATDPGGARVLKFAPSGEVLAVGRGARGGSRGSSSCPWASPSRGRRGCPIYVADSGNAPHPVAVLPQAEPATAPEDGESRRPCAPRRRARPRTRLMIQALWWWLVVQVVALCALPLA